MQESIASITYTKNHNQQSKHVNSPEEFLWNPWPARRRPSSCVEPGCRSGEVADIAGSSEPAQVTLLPPLLAWSAKTTRSPVRHRESIGKKKKKTQFSLVKFQIFLDAQESLYLLHQNVSKQPRTMWLTDYFQDAKVTDPKIYFIPNSSPVLSAVGFALQTSDPTATNTHARDDPQPCKISVCEESALITIIIIQDPETRWHPQKFYT